MKNSKKQGPTQWFIFFKDQLLLKKEKTEKGEIKYSVPYGTEPPLAPGSGSTIHEVFLPTDEMVHAFAIEQLVTETEEWVMVNLRGSYEYITLDEYKAAGKAYQILYWDQHSRFCPACGMPTEHKTPIMKKVPFVCLRNISTYFYSYHCTNTPRGRNLAGTCPQFPRNILWFGSRFPRSRRNSGTMRTTRSDGRNRITSEEYHLFRQPALALSQRTDGRLHC